MKIFFNHILFSIIFMAITPTKFCAKRMVSAYKTKVNKTHWFNFVPLVDILQKHSEISYTLAGEKVVFDYKPFPLSIDHSKQPFKGYLLSTFILKIPHAVVQGMNGLILIDNKIIDEMVWRACPTAYGPELQASQGEKNKALGKVAVITQPAYGNYFHWTIEVLARLALLEKENIEYDYLYVPQTSKFMRDSLKMWGISEEKIIAPTSDDFAIQADEIILPSLVSNSNHGWTQFVNYIRPELVEYVKNKLLQNAQNSEYKNFSKKIFISRKDAPFRKLINEDEIFHALEKYGFERYELSKLTVVEQIQLFTQAEIIVSPQGTGLANSIYCNQTTKIIELFQGLCDCTFWYIAQDFGLNYIPVQTINFEHNFLKAWRGDTAMPVTVVEKIKKYFN